MDYYYEWPHSNQVYNYDYNLGGYYNSSNNASAPPQSTPNNTARTVPTTTGAQQVTSNNYYNPYQQAPTAPANYYSYEKNPVTYMPAVQQTEQTLPTFDSYANNWTTSTGPAPPLNVNQVSNYNMHLQPPIQITATSQTAPMVTTSSGDQNLWSTPLESSNYTMQSYYDAYSGYSLPLKPANSRNIGSAAGLYPDTANYFTQPITPGQNEYTRYSTSKWSAGQQQT